VIRSIPRRLRRLAAVVLCLALAGTVAAPHVARAQAVEKKTVRTADDLPRFTYPMAIAPSELLQSDATTFAAWAAPVAADLDAELAAYDVRDHATLRGLLAEKLDLEMLSGTHDAEALETVRQIRALEDKPDAKLLSGVTTEAVVAARAETGATSGDAFRAAYARHYAAALAQLPWPVVAASLRETKMTYEILTPTLAIGQVHGSVDPAAEKTHTVDNDTAGLLIRTRFTIDVLLPLTDVNVATIAALIAANDVSKPDIFAGREVRFAPGDRLTPVRVAVWDSGSDLRLFADRLYTDPHPGPYDPHGLAFDLASRPAHGALMPLSPAQQATYVRMIGYLQGESDLQLSIDSPAAAALRKRLAALPAADVPAFFQDFTLAEEYAHGTHVTGIALRGNPAARLVVARIEYDYKTIPTPPSNELERRGAVATQSTVNYFRAHGVRVVNMSWGETLADVARLLEKNAIGKDAAERKTLAEHYFAIDRAGLLAALRSAPNILFVCSAGNSDSDAAFSNTIPAGFTLPNLLVVGAVDQAGDETSFTSYGKNVLVDADGYEVESVVPGGTRVKLSGTSMAAPNVTNLAAKLLALDPALTPEETIGLIRAGARASADGRRHNIDPERSVELLRRRLAARR
jgi:hypothetical protein